MTPSAPGVSLQRCFNHALREAAARCPECLRFFCRECVAEHDDRVLCAACLKKIATPGSAQRRALSKLVRPAQVVFGILLAWFFFFVLGETLLRIPDSFHETSTWRPPWIDTE